MARYFCQIFSTYQKFDNVFFFIQIYNVVDKGQTTQGKVSSIISDIFDINHDYWGTAFTTLAKVRLKVFIFKSTRFV